MEEGSVKQVRDMLENDEYLIQQTIKSVDVGQKIMRKMFQTVRVVHACLQYTQATKRSTVSDLSVRALGGELYDSNVVEEMLATAKTLDSDKIHDILSALRQIITSPQAEEIRQNLENLLESCPESGPLRSGYNINSMVTKTIVVQQRIQLSKGRAELSDQDSKYTEIVDQLVALLQEHLTETLINPQDLFLHEAFLFDLRNPMKETFGPRPRFAIERALTTPFDYLLSSTDADTIKISAKQPATAVLYQLYLDSGAMVNVHDLWQAFLSVFESEQGKAFDDRVVMSLFYSALSELKAFGVIKNSRKKTDHLAKCAWMGL